VIDPIVVIGAFHLAAGGLLYVAYTARHRALQRGWREAARRAGLTGIRTGSATWLGAVTGAAGGLGVSLSRYKHGKYEYGTQITIRGDSGLTLRPEEAGSGIESLLGVREIEVGDPPFDAAVWVLGAPETARAVLDAETREELRGLLAGPGAFSVADGDLRARIPDRDGPTSPEALAGVLKTLLAMARKLQRPADLVGRLAENAEHDPEWQVRLQNLLLLAESFPRHPRTREALRRACEDGREDVQLAAALALEDDLGRRTLMEIASREGSADDCMARAVTGLGEAQPSERLQTILAHALRTRRMRTAGACLDVLGLCGGPAVVEPLAKVLAIENGSLGIAAARALGASRAEGAEAPLLRALDGAPAPVREAAATALGFVGSARAVLPLKGVAASSSAGGPLRRAARQAVAEIQGRLRGVASPGQLSLADPESGQLSLAGEDRRGQVSMAERRKPNEP
jgi:hypothetical protein